VPGVKIPIVPSAHMTQHVPDCIIIFAWNFAAEILKKIGSLESRGVEFLIPLKHPKGANTARDPGSMFTIKTA